MQVWTLNRKRCWEEEEEEARKGGRCGKFMLLTASPLPAPPSLSLSPLSPPLHTHTGRRIHTCSSDTLSLLSFSSAPQSASLLSLLSSHKGQRDQQSMTLLIEAHMCRAFAAALWIIAKTCHWLRKDRHNQSGEKKDTVKRRRKLSATLLGFFWTTSVMGDQPAGEAWIKSRRKWQTEEA